MPCMCFSWKPWRAVLLCTALAPHSLGKVFEGARSSYVVQQYNPAMTQAFVSLATLAYCAGEAPRGVPSGLRLAVEKNCGTGESSFCKAAGFHVKKGSVKWVNVADKGKDNSLFAIVAQWRRNEAVDTVDHSGGCLIAFRGSIGLPPNGPNWQRNAENKFVNATAWPDCHGCKVHQGYYGIWQKMQPAILNKLKELQCTAGNHTPLYITGHSLGAAVSYMAIYALQTKGFNVQQPYIFAPPRPGNSHFITSFAGLFDRVAPVFLISNGRDKTPRGPTNNLFKHAPFQVFYYNNDPEEYTICYDPTDETCGMNKFELSTMAQATSPPDKNPHCTFPMAPYGNICQFTGSLWMYNLGTAGKNAFQRVCTQGGLMAPSPGSKKQQKSRRLLVV